MAFVRIDDASAWLERFVAEHIPRAEEDAVWTFEGAPLPLHIDYYDDVSDAPPEPLVTSVRAVVLCGDQVLTLRNPDAVHALPGGRRELGESFEETLRRELLEEAACTITNHRLLGIAHLRHVAERPRSYSYLYPDFLWAIYVADSDAPDASCIGDDYEIEARFEPVAAALNRVDLPSRIYIEAALRARD